MTNRAYSLLEVKSIDEDARELTGWATTPTPDRMQDVVEPGGAKYVLPVPLLWQHNSAQPIGHVVAAKVSEKGIEIKAKLAKVDEPGALKTRLDEAWQSIKSGLVRGLSIGFRGIESAEIKGTWGIRYLAWEWLELSAVTVPANAEASIQTIKSIDSDALAAAGKKREPTKKTDPPPGAKGTKPTASGRFFFAQSKGKTVKTVREQIEALEASREAKSARRAEIQQKAMDEGRGKDEAEKTEFDDLTAEIKALDVELVDLAEIEKTTVRKATPVKPEGGTDPQRGAEIRNGVIRVEPNQVKGTDFVRFTMAVMQAKGNLLQAKHIAEHRWKDSHRVITSLKTAVDAGTTADSTWASPLVEYQTMTSEFMEYLRPQTLIGRIPGIRRVPFNTRIQRQTAGSSGSFVGEGAPKPVNELAFDAITLGFHKAAVIVVMSMELARFSDPNAEAVIRQDMVDGITAYLDKRFIDPQYSATSVSPASITNGIAPVASTGTTLAAITADVESAMGAFLAADLDPSRAVWIMSPVTALSLSMRRNSYDQFTFPTVTAEGGTFFGRPVIVSRHVAAAGSPTEQLIVLMDPSEVLLADDGSISIDMSQEASLQMNDAPSAGAQSLVSLWQNNLAALRAEKMITWRRRRDAGIQIIGNANW